METLGRKKMIIVRFDDNKTYLEFYSRDRANEYVWYSLHRPNLKHVHIEEWNEDKLVNKSIVYLKGNVQ